MEKQAFLKVGSIQDKNGKSYDIHQLNKAYDGEFYAEYTQPETPFLFPDIELKDNWEHILFNIMDGDIVVGTAGIVGIRRSNIFCVECGLSCFIKEDYRGLGLHKASIKFRLDFAKIIGIHMIYTDVANDISYNNLIKCGLEYSGDRISYNAITKNLQKIKTVYKIL